LALGPAIARSCARAHGEGCDLSKAAEHGLRAENILPARGLTKLLTESMTRRGNRDV
jgi:hypothetical protein